MNLRSANLFGRFAVLTDDQVLPITNMFDAYGEDTDNPEEVVKIVVGPSDDGKWAVFDLTGGERERNN